MRQRIAMKNLPINVGLLFISVTLCFLAGELIIRSKGTYDVNGTFRVLGNPLHPHVLPIANTRKIVNEYLTASPPPFIVYDPLVGWEPRANGISRDGLYKYTSAGIRTDVEHPREYSLLPPGRTLRIAIFGDSYTHGDQVPFPSTWGYHLEEALKTCKINAEVLNFGVRGYSMGQAFLRYRKTGHLFTPHIVIFGFQAENVKRNVSILRPFYKRTTTTFPFSTPRFILVDGSLQLLNSPALPPEKVADIIQHIEEWELRRYEYFYDPEDYRDHFWLRSRLLALTVQLLTTNRLANQKRDEAFYSLGHEPATVSLAIINEFRKEVEAAGGVFLTVHLPTRHDLETRLRGSELAYVPLLKRVSETTALTDPQTALLEEAGHSSLESLFTGHYSDKGNKIVANALLQTILKQQHLKLDVERLPIENPGCRVMNNSK